MRVMALVVAGVAMVWMGGVAVPLFAQTGGVLGRWTTPDGSTVDVEGCGDRLCLRLVGISKSAPAQVDGLNPDTKLRSRPLCGLEIGTGFKRVDADHADGGKLYDPQSGKTYSGTITRQGDTLALHGYVGLKLFGRTETWTQAKATAPVCK